jgi:TRAP-type mannitol/chloroaromatic compound transport system substrate-binding protein
VSSGAFQLAHSAAYYFVGRRAAHGMFTSLPFGMNAQQQTAWIEQGGGQELWNELNAPDNLISFNLGNTGTQMGGWFKREINSPADLQGLSIRTAGLVGEVYRKAGANVQSLPGGEIFLALDRGAIDAADWVGPYDDEKLGLNRAAPYYYTPGWQEPSAMLNLYVNLELWNSLDANLQSAVHNAARSATTLMLAKYDANNGPALQRLIASGTEVRRFPTEVLDNFRRFADEVFAEKAAADRSSRGPSRRSRRSRPTSWTGTRPPRARGTSTSTAADPFGPAPRGAARCATHRAARRERRPGRPPGLSGPGSAAR